MKLVALSLLLVCLAISAGAQTLPQPVAVAFVLSPHDPVFAGVTPAPVFPTQMIVLYLIDPNIREYVITVNSTDPTVAPIVVPFLPAAGQSGWQSMQVALPDKYPVGAVTVTAKFETTPVAVTVKK